MDPALVRRFTAGIVDAGRRHRELDRGGRFEFEWIEQVSA
jgi:hypothetical protein